MNKYVLIIGMLMFNLFSFSIDNKFRNINYSGDYRQEDYDLRKIIKKQTEVDLKKLGIKKVLLYNKGFWIGQGNRTITFNKNGVLLVNVAERAKIRMLWKVINNKLYINPKWGKFIKFYLIIVKPEEPSDSRSFLKRVKYKVCLKSIAKAKDNTGTFYNIVYFNLTAYKKGTFSN